MPITLLLSKLIKMSRVSQNSYGVNDTMCGIWEGRENKWLGVSVKRDSPWVAVDLGGGFMGTHCPSDLYFHVCLKFSEF